MKNGRTQKLVFLIVMGVFHNTYAQPAGFQRTNIQSCVTKYQSKLNIPFSAMAQKACEENDDSILDIAAEIISKTKVSSSVAIDLANLPDPKNRECIVQKMSAQLSTGQQADPDQATQDCAQNQKLDEVSKQQRQDLNATMFLNANRTSVINSIFQWLGITDSGFLKDLNSSIEYDRYYSFTSQIAENFAVEHDTRPAGQGLILYKLFFKVGQKQVSCLMSDYVKDRLLGIHLCSVSGGTNNISDHFTLNYDFSANIPESFKPQIAAVQKSGAGINVNKFDKKQSDFLLIRY